MNITTYLTSIGRAIMNKDQQPSRCILCELHRDAEMSREHEFDRIAAQDPELSGGHSYATDCEWVEFLDQQERS